MFWRNEEANVLPLSLVRTETVLVHLWSSSPFFLGAFSTTSYKELSLLISPTFPPTPKINPHALFWVLGGKQSWQIPTEIWKPMPLMELLPMIYSFICTYLCLLWARHHAGSCLGPKTNRPRSVWSKGSRAIRNHEDQCCEPDRVMGHRN